MRTTMLPSPVAPHSGVTGGDQESAADRRFPLDDVDDRPASRRSQEPRSAPTARQGLSGRILSEFEEMPGMALTVGQASRLFGVSGSVCAQLLRELAAADLLHERVDGRYALQPGSMSRKAR